MGGWYIGGLALARFIERGMRDGILFRDVVEASVGLSGYECGGGISFWWEATIFFAGVFELKAPYY